MDCCSSDNAELSTFDYAPEIDQLTDRLADLLAQTPEYIEYIRLAQLLDLDPDVIRISREIRNRQMVYAGAGDKSVEDMQAEMETLPAVQAYRTAEAAVKDLFHSVDQVISASAGVEFALNAQPRAYG